MLRNLKVTVNKSESRKVMFYFKESSALGYVYNFFCKYLTNHLICLVLEKLW